MLIIVFPSDDADALPYIITCLAYRLVQEAVRLLACLSRVPRHVVCVPVCPSAVATAGGFGWILGPSAGGRRFGAGQAVVAVAVAESHEGTGTLVGGLTGGRDEGGKCQSVC